jgi:DNA-directed RNA polymerase specialized sigma24 family protein
MLYKRRSLMGDKSWLKKIYFEYQNLVYSIAVSIIKDVQLAEDIVQEVFVTLYFKAGDIRDRKKIKHWLVRDYYKQGHRLFKKFTKGSRAFRRFF